MIRVDIYRDEHTRHIVRYNVTGHAEYDVAGKDIVCAGVSAIVVGTVNAIEALLDIQLEHRMDKGLLDVYIPELADEARNDKLQWQLETMLVMLHTIEQSYGEYIQIQTIVN